jgi:hypothetical protein
MESGNMHLVQSVIALSAPQNETRITLLISGEHAHLTEIIHDMCRMALQRAIEPLQQIPASSDA